MIKNDNKDIKRKINMDFSTSIPASAGIDFLTQKINQDTSEFG